MGQYTDTTQPPATRLLYDRKEAARQPSISVCAGHNMSMVEIEGVMAATSSIGSTLPRSDASFDDPPKRDAEDTGRPNSATRVAPEVSLSGLVDAILEVGRQRKVLLDQVRCALVSGNDAEALRFARQLCGIHEMGSK
jgi:hypothetical protein